MNVQYEEKLAVCEICGEPVYRGEGNVTMMGFKGSHCVHILHIENDYEAYHAWRNNLLASNHTNWK